MQTRPVESIHPIIWPTAQRYIICMVCQVIVLLLLGSLNGWPTTGQGLGGIVVELRDQNGRVIQTTRTAPDGTYSFSTTGICDTTPCYVITATDRNQVTSPAQSKAVNTGAWVKFDIKGVPATIHVTGSAPGTFVLVTPTSDPLPPSTPDTISQVGGNPKTAYSGVVGLDAVVDIPVPTGSYNLTCWTQISGIYTPLGSHAMNGSNALQPNNTYGTPNRPCTCNSCP